VVDDLGRPLSRISVPNDSSNTPEEAARRINDAIASALDRADLAPADAAGAGIGCWPGAFRSGREIRGGLSHFSSDAKGAVPFGNAAESKDAVRSILRESVGRNCGLPVEIVNGPSAAAYGEFWVGAARDYKSLVLLTLGEEIGCGMIVGDLVIEGERGWGEESGHMLIDFSDDARLCACGLRGHLAAYVTTRAVIERTCEVLAAGRSSLLAQGPAGPPTQDSLTLGRLTEAAEAGDALSLEILDETARYVGVGAVNLMHTLDPTGVLLSGALTFGGQATPLGRRFLAGVRAEMARQAFAILVEKTIIDCAALGDDANFIGAAGLARLKLPKGHARG